MALGLAKQQVPPVNQRRRAGSACSPPHLLTLRPHPCEKGLADPSPGPSQAPAGLCPNKPGMLGRACTLKSLLWVAKPPRMSRTCRRCKPGPLASVGGGPAQQLAFWVIP